MVGPFISEVEAVCVVEDLKTLTEEALVAVKLIPLYPTSTGIDVDGCRIQFMERAEPMILLSILPCQ